MDTLPRRPSGSGAVGLVSNGGLKTRINDQERTVVNQTGIHLQPYDFNGLQMPFYEIYDASGVKHTMSVDEDGLFIIDGNEYLPKNIVVSESGLRYEITVDDSGNLKAVQQDV